jgi:CBS domain-containing protein
MKVSEIMTRNVATCSPNDTLGNAAKLMLEKDAGFIPICEQGGNKIIGVVTDRDLACRGLAKGKGPDANLQEVFTKSCHCVKEDDDVEAAQRVMREQHIRRVPVLSRDEKLVGVVSLANFASSTSEQQGGGLLKSVSSGTQHSQSAEGGTSGSGTGSSSAKKV